jgi:hypothetical protein
MGVGERDGAGSVPHECELLIVAFRYGDSGQDIRALVREPAAVQRADGLGDPAALPGGDIGQHGGVVDQQGRAGRRLAGQGREIGQQVAAVDARRVPAGRLDGGRQPLPAPGLAGPEQALQPADVIVVGNVERVQVQPGAPDDVGYLRGKRDRTKRSAAEDRRIRIRPGEAGSDPRNRRVNESPATAFASSSYCADLPRASAAKPRYLAAVPAVTSRPDIDMTRD